MLADLPMLYYWARAFANKGKYVQTVFVLKGISLSTTGRNRYRLLARGTVNEGEETLRSWREYAMQRSIEEIPAGERWVVFYDSQATHFRFFGRTLRVLSATEFNVMPNQMFWHLLYVWFPSSVALGLGIILRRRIQRTQKSDE